MLAIRVMDFTLEHIAAISKKTAVESQAVGNPGFRRAGIAYGPAAPVEFVHPTPRVAANVGRIVPCAVVHDAPSQELRARIVAIAVVIKEISYRKTANGYAVAGDRPRSR